MQNDSLGDRMKAFEAIPKNFLMRKTPVIIRVDGKSFHNFCKRFKKPYDEVFHDCMNDVMYKLCCEIQGAKFAQRHSDEISIVVTDFGKNNTDAYFQYNVQKISSLVASLATAELCRLLQPLNIIKEEEQWPMFDCRCFNIPEHDVSNYFWWRILDAKRNSINMLAQSLFSHKDLQGKDCNQMQEMLFSQHGINWNNLPQGQKVGFCCYKVVEERAVDVGPNKGLIFNRNVWKVNPTYATKDMLDILVDPRIKLVEE